jgi:hypothetical protein
MEQCIRRAIARARNGICQPPSADELKRIIVAYEVGRVFEYEHNLQGFFSVSAELVSADAKLGCRIEPGAAVDRGTSLQAAAQRQHFSREPALPPRHPVSIETRMENTMHRLLVAVALGVGLLTGGSVVGAATARPVGDRAVPHTIDRTALVTPVHDEYARPHYYAPPPRHWHRPEPRWHDHSRYERHDGYRYGSRW